MKGIILILLVLLFALLGFFFIRTRENHDAGVGPPTQGAPVSFTDSNGNEFTVYVAGAAVNGTNIVVTNLDFKAGPAGSRRIVLTLTNAAPK